MWECGELEAFFVNMDERRLAALTIATISASHEPSGVQFGSEVNAINCKNSSSVQNTETMRTNINGISLH